MAQRPGLIIWDSSAAFLSRAGFDEDRAGDVTKFWSGVLTPCARRAGAAVLAIDHVVKSGAATRYARGSGAKLAAVDVAYLADATVPFSRSQDGILTLTVTKDRRGWLHRSHRIEVTRSPLHLNVTEQHAPTSKTRPPAQAKLLEALGADPVTVHVLVDRVEANHGHGLTRETVSKALKALLLDGLADKIDQGNGRPALWFKAAGQTRDVTGTDV